VADFADGTGLSVRPEVLDAEAGVFAAAALAVDSGTQRTRAALAAGADGLAGWRSGAALDDCAVAWAQCLSTLSAALDGDADNLRVTAGNYRAVDAALARQLAEQRRRQPGHWQPGR
jgi:uncharacterized protein YukE